MFIGEVQAQAKLVANLRRELEAAEADLTRKIDVYLRSHRSTDLARTLLQETLKGTGGGRYFMCMRSVLFLVLALAGLGHADERADRLAIERMVASLNERVASRRPLRQFFTLDAEKEFAALQDLDRRLHPSAQLPWSEVTAPSIVVASLRFLTADVALADAASTRFGSTSESAACPSCSFSAARRRSGRSRRFACWCFVNEAPDCAPKSNDVRVMTNAHAAAVRIVSLHLETSSYTEPCKTF